MRGHAGHGPGRGFRGGWQQADLPPAGDAAAWFAGRLPDGWFVGEPTVSVDREEIVVTGELPPPEGLDEGTEDDTAEGTDAASGAAAAQGRISRFREETREARMQI